MKMTDEKEFISDELRKIIRNTNDLMFVKNKDFVYVEASKSFAEDCVRVDSVEGVIGKTDFELFKDSTVAQKYREDDEKLFESGKTMIEFEEIYLDESGNKNVCLTTKYLLRDKEGKPAGIFGQYHDIGKKIEEEISRHKDINKNVVSALSASFFASNYVDLRNHTYVVLRSRDYTEKMLENCDTMEKAFESFIKTLVKPEFQDKMREFCDSDTIAERVKGKTQIACEYLSNVATGWCRASFFPVEWDEAGEVTNVLFAVSSIDENIAHEIEEGISNKKYLQEDFDNVPGGIIMYDWDGEELKLVKISKYYKEKYGYSLANDKDSPDFLRIHPDDIEDYKNAINFALTVTHSLEYVFRVWKREENKYGWTKITAVSKEQPNGHSYVYAMYTDVTDQKIAEQRLKKSQAAIMAALGAAEQFSYEYDPVAHTSTCFTDENNGYNLDKVIKNYPECFRDNGFMHPDDVEMFIETTHKIDKGAKSSHCNIRVNKDGRYHWHSCTFDSFYDTEKERRVALLTVVDITPKMTAMSNYEKRMKMLVRTNEDAMCMCDVNITKNKISNVQAVGNIKENAERAHTLDEFMRFTSNAVFDDRERQIYNETFNCKNILELFEKGNSHIKFEHFYRISDKHTEWVETVFELVEDPVSGEIVGIAYARSMNNMKMSRILLDAALEKDYPMAALVYQDTGEYYLYELENGEFCEHKQDYWGRVFTRVTETVDDKDIIDVRANLTRKEVILGLSQKDEYVYVFYGMYHGERCRLEAKFRYVDKEHGLILATLRNITDEALYQQYKYESEHDPVTGLLNRRTLFLKCRKLLTEHPDEQFVMMHGDMKHFHLYNTFFGDEAGDHILRLMADAFRDMSKDYEYWAYGRVEADVFCTFFPYKKEILEKHVKEFLGKVTNFRSDFLIEAAIGVYMVTDPSMTIEAMFSRASIAAKSDKKNLFDVISVYDDKMEQKLVDSQQVIQEMQKAIDNEEFKVYLQPKYSLRTEKMVGSEALVRWIHPEKGMISPGKFIPVFEGNGFITTLDRYMWEHVCQILRKWQDEGQTMYPISVNVSRISMYIQSTVPFLINLVTRYGIDPKYLELELTESAYMDDPEDLKRMLRELKEFGFTILMDDFGSGYSSLNTLRELPVDILKLDMKFLSKSQNDNRGMAVLSSVVRMSKLLNLPIVAEGVEKKEQANYLRDIGCEYVQGFLFARPMPLEEYEQLLDLQDEPAESKIQVSKSHVMEMIADQESLANSISEAFPTPVAFIEYEKDRMAILRANNKFLHQFGLIEDQRPASLIIKEKLDSHSYQILMDSLEECVKTQESVTFNITWPGEKGPELLVGCVDYEGTMDQLSNMMLVFMNMSNLKK